MARVFDTIDGLKKRYGEDNVEFASLIHSPLSKEKISLSDKMGLIEQGFESIGFHQGSQGVYEEICYRIKK